MLPMYLEVSSPVVLVIVVMAWVVVARGAVMVGSGTEEVEDVTGLFSDSSSVVDGPPDLPSAPQATRNSDSAMRGPMILVTTRERGSPGVGFPKNLSDFDLG